MSEKFEYYPTAGKQEEFKKLQEEDPVKTGQIVEEAHEEGNKFNDLLKRGKIDAEFLSKVISREQTPEQVYEVFERLISKLQDVKSLGAISHVSAYGEIKDAEDIVVNGLKDRGRLQREGKFKHGMFRETIFEHHVSFAAHNGSSGRYEFILDNDFLKYIFRNDNSFFDQIGIDLGGKKMEEKECIKFVGEEFHDKGAAYSYSLSQGSGREKMLDEAEKLGWIDAARQKFEATKRWYEKSGYLKNSDNLVINKIRETDHFDRETFAYTYFRPLENSFYHGHSGNTKNPHSREIVIDFDNIYANEFQGNSLSGVIAEYSSKDLVGLINKLSVEEIKNAVPIYSGNGDLIWPVKTKHAKIVKFLKIKEITIEQKEEINSKLDEMAAFIYENQKKASAIEIRRRKIEYKQSEGKKIDDDLLNLDATTEDNFWQTERKCFEFNAEELTFNDLPNDWREEALSAASNALRIVFEGANLGKNFDESFIEESAIKYQYSLSIENHIDPFVVNWGGEYDLYRDYFKLDDIFKEQRKAVIRKAIELFKKANIRKEKETEVSSNKSALTDV